MIGNEPREHISVYRQAEEIRRHEYSFAALVMAAVLQADTGNRDRLSRAFPEIVAEVRARGIAPNGLLPGERDGWMFRGRDGRVYDEGTR